MPRPLSRCLSTVRPELTQLEDRMTPVAITTAGTFATLDLDTAGEIVTLSTDGTSVSVSTTAGITLNGSPVSNPQSLTGFTSFAVTDSAAGTGLIFANSTGGYAATLTATLDNAPGQVTFNGSSAFGSNDLSVTTTRNILLSGGASLTTTSGDITLSANRQATPTGGDFIGVDIAGTLTTATGELSVAGTGGDAAGGSQSGVSVRGGGLVSSTGGAMVTVVGTGGASGGNSNAGVLVSGVGSRITSGGGAVSVTGTGGGSGASSGNSGVAVDDGLIIAGGIATVTVVGTGGTSIGGSNHGVSVVNSSGVITSSGGAVSVTGTGGNGNGSFAVLVGATGAIQSGGNAAVTLVGDSMELGTGGVNAGTGMVTLRPRTVGTRIDLGGADVLTGTPLTLGITDAELDRITAGSILIGDYNTAYPITVSAAVSHAGDASLTMNTTGNIVVNAGASLTTANANLVLLANRPIPAAAGNYVGIDVQGTIATVNGRMDLNGRGGTSAVGSQDGVRVWNGGLITTTGSGSMNIYGYGGGSGNSAFNDGVFVSDGGLISTASGALNIFSYGGGGTASSSSRGLAVSGSGKITSTTGQINISSTGGSGSGAGNDGVAVENGGTILGGSLAPSISGFTGSGSGGNRGVSVDGAGSIITSISAGASVFGSGPINGGGVNTVGVMVTNGGVIDGGSAGVGVRGGGYFPIGAGTTVGVVVSGANSAITSTGGNVFVAGINSSLGVDVRDGGTISAGGGGKVSVSSAFIDTIGRVSGGSIRIETGGLITGTAAVSVTADSVDIDPTGGVAGRTVTISPTSQFGARVSGIRITVGGAAASGLSLTDAELDRVTAGTLVIGSNLSDTLTVSADITRPTATNLRLLSGRNIVVNGGIDTGGGTLFFSPTTFPYYGYTVGISFPKAGTDITATATSFVPNSTLRMNVAGSVADSQYDRLVATGTVDLTGTTLALTGSYVPQPGESFVIVSAGSVVGTFAGLPNGSIVRSGSGHFRLTYSPTAVTLTALPHPLVVTAVGSTVRVEDRVTGIATEFTPFAGFAGSVTVATADLNGDGVLDIVVGAGAGGGPNVKVFDGATLAETASIYAFDPIFTGGVFVAASGNEIVVGAGASGSPHVKVIDATKLGQVLPNGQIADSALLASFFAYDPSFTGGVRVAFADVNNDGVPDVVAGAGAGGGPHVKVIDGTKLGQKLANGQIADSALSASFFAFDASFTGGVFVAATDGQIAVGADAGGGPNAKLFNQFGVETQSFYAYDQSFTGGVRVAFADVNNDGIPDLVTGAGPCGGPHVRAFNIAPFAEMSSFFASDPLDTRGVSV